MLVEELKYLIGWIKSVFHQQDIVFPILTLRNSVMWIEEKDYKKME